MSRQIPCALLPSSFSNQTFDRQSHFNGYCTPTDASFESEAEQNAINQSPLDEPHHEQKPSPQKSPSEHHTHAHHQMERLAQVVNFPSGRHSIHVKEEIKIHVCNLPYNTSHTQIGCLFSQYGEVLEAFVLKRPHHKNFCRSAIVRVIPPEGAELAIRELDGVVWRGNKLRVRRSVHDTLAAEKRLDFNGCANSRRNAKRAAYQATHPQPKEDEAPMAISNSTVQSQNAHPQPPPQMTSSFDLAHHDDSNGFGELPNKKDIECVSHIENLVAFLTSPLDTSSYAGVPTSNQMNPQPQTQNHSQGYGSLTPLQRSALLSQRSPHTQQYEDVNKSHVPLENAAGVVYSSELAGLPHTHYPAATTPQAAPPALTFCDFGVLELVYQLKALSQATAAGSDPRNINGRVKHQMQHQQHQQHQRYNAQRQKRGGVCEQNAGPVNAAQSNPFIHAHRQQNEQRDYPSQHRLPYDCPPNEHFKGVNALHSTQLTVGFRR